MAEIGSIEEKKMPEGVQVEWKIAGFSSMDQTGNYESPTFTFEGDWWYLDLCHRDSSEYPRTVSLCLNNDEAREYLVEYNFSFKKLDNSVEQIGIGIMEEENTYSLPKDYIKLPEIIERKSELLLSDTLTIVCSLKRKEITEHSIHPTALSRPQHKELIKLDTLSENFKHLFSTGENSDTTLHVQDKVFKAHMIVLSARSSVFAAMFHHETKEKQTGIISIPDCNPESFEDFLEFLYCGKLECISSRSALQLYETSDKYDVQELKTFCIEYLMKNLTVGDLCDAVIMADKYDEVKLFSAVQDFFIDNGTEVLQTSEWELLMKKNFRLGNKLLIEMSKKAAN